MEKDNSKSLESADEEEDEEEEEPKLKYERIGSSLLEILDKDAASCMSVHSKFLALGTHWGVVHILDHQGNNIRSKEFPSHTTTVNQISIDSNGDYVASCSEDGRVVINGLYTGENNIQHTFDCPIRAVGLHPDFGHRGNKQYVIGVGEKLTLYEKGWLRNKSVILHSGEGFVRSIRWKNNFIAWANFEGVEVYDTNAKERITHISRETQSAREELFHCNICWKDDTVLLIAWASTIKVCVVRQRSENDVRGLPRHLVEIVHVFSTDFYASGIAPFGDELAILAYTVDEECSGAPQKGKSQRPLLIVIKPNGVYEYEETSTNTLSVRGFEEYLCSNYYLEHVEEEQLFYIVSPKDIIIARPRDMDDHISWLIEQQFFKEALQVAKIKQKELKRHSVLNVGKRYLSHLLTSGEYQDAALMCNEVLGNDKALWEEQVYIFIKEYQLKAITPFIPFSNPQLDGAIYELILNDNLQTDHKAFYELICNWPIHIYKSQYIIHSLQVKLLEVPNQSLLLQSLATLYAHNEKYGEALRIYLTLGHNDVFQMIYRHKLLSYVQDKCKQLMLIDANKATNMFIENLQQFSVKMVVEQLESDKKLLHQYLHTLFTKDPSTGQEFHNMQVELYAEFERNRLQTFLSNSNYYQLEHALQICTERKLIPEMVFLLGRMGNNKKALSLIIEKLGDIQKAIEFAKDENDEDLWHDLITQSLDKPDFIIQLLSNIGTHVDPKILIKRIPPAMEIPGLRDALVKILQDYNLQVSLHEGCKTILDKDSVGLINKQLKGLARGYSVSATDTCHTCQGKLVADDHKTASSIAVFFCKHLFHEGCLQQEHFCPICESRNSSTRKKTLR